MNLIKKTALGVAAAATVLTVASPAEAQSRYRYRHRDNGGAAVVAGIAGLAIGAAIASSNRGSYYDPYYRGSYGNYYDPYYRGSYYDPYYNQGYYNQRYYPQYRYSQPQVVIRLGTGSRYYGSRYRGW